MIAGQLTEARVRVQELELALAKMTHQRDVARALEIAMNFARQLEERG